MVEAARRGDAESFGTLYARHYAAMVWLAYSILLDRTLAEDAAQQAFCKACEKLANLKRADRFVPWLAPMYREIVVLHYYQRMDYRQIAATLGIAGHTVRGRLFRARKQIEQTLRRNGVPER